MSTPGSTALDPEAARRAADRERRRPPVSEDPQFEAVRRAGVGSAALVSSPDGAPVFCLVPFEIDGRACGVARVELSATASHVSTFGSGPRDREAWPDVSFFEHPSAALVAEATRQHPTLQLKTARLSYDGAPAKWGWRIETADGATVVFITTGGWYARKAGQTVTPEREG